jgi:hypothetical protein
VGSREHLLPNRDHTLISNPLGNHCSARSCVASAAGRLRPNGVLGHHSECSKVLVNAETVHVGTGTNFSGLPTNQHWAAHNFWLGLGNWPETLVLYRMRVLAEE